MWKFRRHGRLQRSAVGFAARNTAALREPIFREVFEQYRQYVQGMVNGPAATSTPPGAWLSKPGSDDRAGSPSG